MTTTNTTQRVTPDMTTVRLIGCVNPRCGGYGHRDGRGYPGFEIILRRAGRDLWGQCGDCGDRWQLANGETLPAGAVVVCSTSTGAEGAHIAYASETGAEIGPATAEQYAASIKAGDEGHILIDADGDVVEPGTWAAQQPGVRKVYVQ